MNIPIKTYLEKRMLFVFINGIASGFPWVIIGSAMTLWLKELGLSRTAIGFFGLVFAVYSINWMWSPLVDRVRLPVLSRLGQRRSWLLLAQFFLLVFTALMATTDPAANLVWLSLLALCVACCSATQDVVIDAYRIEVLSLAEKDKLPATAALATSGWWVGYGYLGGAALFMSDFGFSWNAIYLMLAFCILLFMANTLFLDEPKSERTTVHRDAQDAYIKLFKRRTIGGRIAARCFAWCLVTLFEPLREFFSRFGYIAVLILLFIVFFKVGEAFLGRMSLVFYKEIGFSTAEIATYSKLGGATLTVIFSILAGAVTVRFGLVRGLMIGGISMAATNLMFAYIAHIGPNLGVFAAAIVIDNFTSAFATVAFVAFISHLTNRAYTATQYALMASLGTLGRTVFAGGSGLLVDSLDGNWELFFIITVLMVIPGLVMLFWIGKNLTRWFE